MSSSLILFLTLLSLCLVNNVRSQINLFTPLLNSGVEWEGCTLISAGFPVMWKYISSNDTITVGVSTSTTGYVALGFNPLKQMIDTDVMIGRFNQNEPTVDDYWISDKDGCSTSSENGVCIDSVYTSPPGTNNKPILISFNRDSSSTFFLYNRFRVGPDQTWDVTVPINQMVYLIWAIGSSDVVTYHQDRGALSFNLTSRAQTCPSNCSGHGKCIGSCCICDVGFLGEDCSLTDSGIMDFGSGVVDRSDYQFGGKLDDNLHLSWNLLNDSNGNPYLDVGLSYHGPSKGWIGFGFSQSSDGHMTPSDTIVCQVFSANSSSANDETFTDRDMEGTQLDTEITNSDGTQGQNNIIAANATTTDSHVYCKWRRYLNTGDELDSVVENKHMKCIFAYSSDPNWGQHDWRHKGRAKINFYTGDIDLEVNLWVIHGGLMFVAWAVLLPVGSLLARYFKFIGDAWFQTHRILQSLGILAQVAGFAVVVAAVNREDESHFREAHGKLGLAVFLLGAIQPFLGQLADFMYVQNRKTVPIFPDRVHWVLGWGAILLGIINIGLGMDFYESPDTPVILYIVWILLVAFSALLIHWRMHRKPYSEIEAAEPKKNILLE